MSLLLHIIVTYIKENIITKLQKLYSLPRNPRAGNKSPALFVKKPLHWRFVARAQNIHWKAWKAFSNYKIIMTKNSDTIAIRVWHCGLSCYSGLENPYTFFRIRKTMFGCTSCMSISCMLKLHICRAFTQSVYVMIVL